MKTKAKNKAIFLRKKGYSLNEISNKLGVSKSTASIWVKKINLDKNAKLRLEKRRKNGYSKSIKSNKIKKDKILNFVKQNAKLTIKNLKGFKQINKLLCAILYWCEGEKHCNSIRFTNSDPLLISTFLYLLRKSYELDEKKFRICLHLHDYHNETRQKNFWSKLTNIPLSQFIKVYKKTHAGKRIKKNYPGCASIRYHDYKIAKELNLIYQLFGKKHGRLG